MKCADCKGSGKYHPLLGPPEDCRACGGTGGVVESFPPSAVRDEVAAFLQSGESMNGRLRRGDLANLNIYRFYTAVDIDGHDCAGFYDAAYVSAAFPSWVYPFRWNLSHYDYPNSPVTAIFLDLGTFKPVQAPP